MFVGKVKKYRKQMLFKWMFLSLICTVPALGQNRSPLENDLSWLEEEKISDFKIKLRRIFDELAFLKRAMELEHNMVPYISTSRVQTKSTSGITKGCTVQVGEAEVVFVVTSENILLELRNATIFSIFDFPQSRDVLSLQALSDGRNVILVALHTNQKFRYFVNIYGYDYKKRNMKRKHKIPLNGISLVSATKIGSWFYMVIVPANLPFPTLKVYQLAGAQYANIASLDLNASCSGLETWNIGVTLYVALSYVDSGRLEILRFLEYSRNFSSIQVIDVHAFVLKLVQEPSNTYLICGTRKSMILYWWTGYRFREMHSKLFQKEILDVTAHSSLGQIVIAVAFHDKVEFLTQDSSARYVSAGYQTFNPANTIKSVLLWEDRRRLFMLPSFKEFNPLAVFEVDLKFDVADPSKEHALEKCINTLDLQITAREKFIEDSKSKFIRLWRPEKASRISHLIVKGSIKASNSTIRTLHLNRRLSSLMSLRIKNVQSTEFTGKLRDMLSKSVRKSVEQSILSDVRFSKLMVRHGAIGQLINDTKINGVSTKRLSHVLKKKGQQTFPYKTTVFTANFTRVTTNLLNKKRTGEYVLLNRGSWNMTGYFTFNNVKAQTVRTRTINDIDVPKFVLRSKYQEITGLKSFKRLAAKFIRTTHQQERHWEMKDLAYSHSNQFQTPVIFDSKLRIKGKLSVSLLNGKNLTQQFMNTVRRNDDVDIYGFKVFHSVVVNETMIVDRINNFSTKNLMTTNTEQYVSGSVSFSDATFQQNIRTISLNGLDLKLKAVKKRLNQYSKIKGVKIFREDLKVSDIIMEDGIQIDYFDPSEESYKIFKTSNHEGFGNGEVIDDVTVGNIVVHNLRVSEKNFTILKELENVWLKTNKQNITTLRIQNMKVNELQVSYVNGMDLDSLVSVTEDCKIEGTIEFLEKMSTKSLKLQKGAKVDYPSDFWNPYVNVKIPGYITIENPVMEGNVIVSGVFENFEAGFMSAATMQDVRGPVEFWTVKLKELKAKDLDFITLNKYDIKEYFDRSVLMSKNKYVHNKKFKTLKGTTMQCFGTLNYVLFDKIATINTPQKFTSFYELYNSMVFKNISLKLLNGIQLEKVVPKDTKGIISDKHFTGNITSLHLSTDENINGVDLTKLNKEAFSKTRTTKTTARITFSGNVTLNELQISRNKTIDGVNLTDLIMINETTKLARFVSTAYPSIIADNVTIQGLINGCNISRIVENALLLKQYSQVITSKVHVNTLKVIGNLSAKYVNGADVLAWIDVLNTTSTTDTDSNVTFQNLVVDNVHIMDTVNRKRLQFLFTDSVRRNSYQAISGLKRFKNIEVKHVDISTMNSNKTCGIDLLDTYRNYINKTAEKEITLYSNLKLAHLKVNNATIDGKLNGLKFPDDVILSNVTEHIESEVLINSTMNATTGLYVTGAIDGVMMKTFLPERVTLNASEMISALLIFENDAYILGETSIYGLINKINLRDVIKVLLNYTLSGQKTFKEELNIMSDATVRGYVNQLLIDSLDKSILRVSRNEASLKGVMKFSNLSLSSLLSVTVNGIGVMDFYNNTHRFVVETRDHLSNITLQIQQHEQSMRDQRDTVEHPLSLFKSFELHTILNFGWIERFLPIYEFGAYGPRYDLHVTSMVLWVRQKSNETGECRSTRSITADVSSDGSFTKTSGKRGKLFPFSLSTEREGVIGFLVQANCTEEQEIRISALGSRKMKKVIKLKPPANATLLDVHLMEVEDVFLIFSYSITGSSGNPERIFVFQFDVPTNTWILQQNFYSQELTSVNIISVDDEAWNSPLKIYLSITGDEVNPGVTIYEWHTDQFYLKTNVSTSASSYSCWVVNHNTLYLLLSKESKGIKCENCTQKAIFSETLEVYTLDEELILNHTVKVKGVTSMDVFMLADETFVLATRNQPGMVYVLQFRGYNGFEVVQAIPSPDATEARVFTVDGHLYVAINSNTGPSSKGVILKATISGGRQGFHLV